MLHSRAIADELIAPCREKLPGMTYLKAVIVGVVTGLLAAVLWVVGSVLWPLAGVMTLIHSGSGGIGTVSVGIDGAVLLVMLLGFIVGFAWTIKRSRERQSTFS